MRKRVVTARVAWLATVTAPGDHTSSPAASRSRRDTICSAVDGKPKTTLALRRLANVEANPVASLLALTPTLPSSVPMRGTLRLLD